MKRYFLFIFILILLDGQSLYCSVTAERILPHDYYLQNEERISVSIKITGSEEEVIVRETIPLGWSVFRTSDATIEGNTLLWNKPSTDSLRIRYYLNAPENAAGDAHFSGTVNGLPIGGDNLMRYYTPEAGKQVPMGSSLYKYWLYLPSDYSVEDAPKPLILFLHGPCMVGDNLDHIPEHYGDGCPVSLLNKPELAETLPELFQCIVVSPQTTESPWNIEHANHFLTELLSTYSVDPNRVYLMGHAIGGQAGWTLANTYPDLLAAFFSLELNWTPSPSIVGAMKGLPVWACEFAKLHWIKLDTIESCIQELTSLGGESVYTLIQSEPSLKEIYKNPELYKWLLRQNKQSRKSFDSKRVILPNISEHAMPLDMVLIPSGTFTMGSPTEERKSDQLNPAGPDRDWPQHQVTISQSFYFGRYEVTQAQWTAIMDSNPSSRIGEDIPVNNVSWEDCQNFIQKLNSLGVGTFRLPTEAEWEYACRAGTQTRFFYGDVLETDDLVEFSPVHDLYMWWRGNTVEKDTPQPVGLKLPNPWGLCDIHGNVWEWCQDWWEAPWDRGSQVDPTGPNTGSARVVRGGGALGFAQGCRSADRRCDFCTPDYQVPQMGFRLVMESENETRVEEYHLY